MKKIIFDLKIEKIDFSNDDFNRTIDTLGNFVFFVDNNYDFLNEMHKAIIDEKGDYVGVNSYESLNVSYITISLIFPSLILEDNDKEIIDKILFRIDELIKSVEIKSDFNCNSTLNLYENIINDQGMIISIDEQGGGFELAEIGIEEFFKENNIEYKRISKRTSWVDMGASGGSEAFIYFIAGAVLSGITWDFIKFGIKKLIGEASNYILTNDFENLNFQHLREVIEDRCKVNIDDLILKEMYRDNDEVLINFVTDKVEINLKTDSKYNIIELICNPPKRL